MADRSLCDRKIADVDMLFTSCDSDYRPIADPVISPAVFLSVVGKLD